MEGKNSAMRRLGTLALFIIACELAGIIGSVFTIPAIPAWYAALAKPPFAPPNWLFAPVWTILYALMGIAAFLVWEKAKGAQKANAIAALKIFCAQLALNVLWSIVFFGLRSPLLGLIVIILMLIAIALAMRQFYSIDRRASWLMAPYILWVSFATILNFSILALNP